MIAELKSHLPELLGHRLTEWLSWVYWNIVAPMYAQPTLHWFFLLSTLAVAALFFATRSAEERRTSGGFLRYMFPREIYAHPSAVVDYKFYVVTQLVMTHLRLGQWVVGLAAILQIAEGIRWVMTAVFGPRASADAQPGAIAVVAFTLVTALAYDYARFLAHYLHHRVPALWEFHKVHHSAEVLTPISSFRAHPVDQMIEFLLRLIATSAVAAVFGYFYPDGITELTVMNYAALTFLFYLTAHLRHSHIPLGYGRLSGIFLSPHMHQLHHSADPRHFDKNFGFMFSIWDRMAGTLLIPEAGERFRLGLPHGAGKFDTVWALYFNPFVEAFRHIVGVLVPAARRSS